MFFSIMSVGFHVFDHLFPGINTAGSTYLYACVFGVALFPLFLCILKALACSNLALAVSPGLSCAIILIYRWRGGLSSDQLLEPVPVTFCTDC